MSDIPLPDQLGTLGTQSSGFSPAESATIAAPPVSAGLTPVSSAACESPVSRVSAARETAPARVPGPALWEALLWTIGADVAHLVGTLFVTLSLLTAFLASRGTAALSKLTEFEAWLMDDALLSLVGGDQAFFLLAAVVAAFVRLGRSPGKKLGLRLPGLWHCALIALLTLPLNVLCTGLYAAATAGWQQIVAVWPGLGFFDHYLSMEAVKPVAERASLPFLILIIAVLPALSEELVFRGVIGRGLIARYGLVPGILLTSVLFGMVHIHPAHAVAVIPLGIALHLVYYWTRSFWAPVLLHLCNNSWAALNAKVDLAPREDAFSTLWVLIAAVAVVVACLWTLWQTRIRYLLPDGEPWRPQYPTVIAPPDVRHLRLTGGMPTPLVLGTGVVSVVLFTVAMAQLLTPA